MLAPNSMATVVVLLVLGLAGLVTVARLGWRPLALPPALAVVASAVLAGALWVNVTYDYYQSWSDAWADISGAPLPTEPLPRALPSSAPLPAAPSADPSSTTPAAPHAVPGRGRLVSMTLAGNASGLSRPAVVWLPAAYDDPGQRAARFPVLLLLHGDPGEPRGFVYGMHVDRVAGSLDRTGTPYVIVMPTVWQGWHGQQCLDGRRGPRDETYLTTDVPQSLQRQLRVTPPGRSWALAGLSEGGYCAVDLALRHPDLFAGAASLDGYYAPMTRGGLGWRLFGGDRRAQAAATPLLTVQSWPTRSRAPALWLMAGDADARDLTQARTFAGAAARVAQVRVVIVRGGNHTTPAWRTALPDLLTWARALLGGRSPQTGQITLPIQA